MINNPPIDFTDIEAHLRRYIAALTEEYQKLQEENAELKEVVKALKELLNQQE